MDIASYIKERSTLIEQRLTALMPEKDVPYAQLFQSARYALLGGGKRLRPILTLATVEAFGHDIGPALSTACALEMVHTYSLVHDDLPCMDDDDFRRGKPALHKAFNEGHAVLTGDYLLTYAFEVISSDVALTAQQKVALIELLAKSSGGHGMIAGQVMDIQAESILIDIDRLQYIHRCKTGALITASVLCGGIIANALHHETETLRSFGQDIGLAFQIMNDILDVTSDRQSDKANGKTTYVTLMGLEAARHAAHTLLERSLSHLCKLQHDTTILQLLTEYLVR